MPSFNTENAKSMLILLFEGHSREIGENTGDVEFWRGNSSVFGTIFLMALQMITYSMPKLQTPTIIILI